MTHPPAPPPPDPAETAAAQTALLAHLAARHDPAPTCAALQRDVRLLARIVRDLQARLAALEARR